MKKIDLHLFFRLSKAFGLFLMLTLGGYALLDFCTKAGDFVESSAFNYSLLFTFYGCEFSKRAYLFLPLCFSLALLTQLIRMNKSKELVALLCGGLSYKKILRPMWILAILVSSMLFANRIYLTPPTRSFLEDFRNDHVRSLKKTKGNENIIYALILKDDSKLVYQSYDPIKKQYFDLFWIISPDRILRIKYLDKLDMGYKARFIDELQRNSQGTFQKKHSFNELTLSPEWLRGAHFDRSLPIQTQTLKAIFQGLHKKDYLFSKNEIYTELFLTLIMSTSPLWIMLMQAPLTTRYSRHLPVLFIVGSHLFFFFTAATVFDGLGIIAQKSVVSPWIVLLIPFLLGYFILYRRYKQKLI